MEDTGWRRNKYGGWFNINDVMNNKIRNDAGLNITAEQLLNDYYKKELNHDDDLLKLMKQKSLSYQQDVQDLKDIIESKDAKDTINVRGYKVKVNLNKENVDIDESVRKYKSNSTYMNNLLNRKGDQLPSADTIRDIENLSSSLKKMNSYQGTVWRYDDRQTLPKPGETIKIDSFYSTSSDKEKLDMVPYYTSRKTLYEIQSKTGKKLDYNGIYSNENEVLFDLGSQFKVVEVKIKDGKNYVVMKQK